MMKPPQFDMNKEHIQKLNPKKRLNDPPEKNMNHYEV